MVAGEEHVGHAPAPEVGGLCVLGVLEDGLVEGVACGASRIAEDPRHHAGDGVGDDHGAEFAAGQYVVADGDEFVGEVFFHAVVHAFVVAADEDEVVVVAVELLGFVLGEGHARRREEDDPAAGGLLGEDGFARFEEGAAHHEHARAAAADGVVYLAVFVVREIAGIRHGHVDEAGFDRPLDDALMEEGFHKFRKQRQDVDFHDSVFPFLEAHGHAPRGGGHGEDAVRDGGEEDVLARVRMDDVHVVRAGVDDFRDDADFRARFVEGGKARDLEIVPLSFRPGGHVGRGDFRRKAHEGLGGIPVFHAFEAEDVHVLMGTGGEDAVALPAEEEALQRVVPLGPVRIRQNTQITPHTMRGNDFSDGDSPVGCIIHGRR